MTDGSYFTIDNIGDIFPLPCEVIPAGGISDGIIVKFKTFYLKIYDIPEVQRYEITRYGTQGRQLNPIQAIVPYSKMREFASRFVHDDYTHDDIIM